LEIVSANQVPNRIGTFCFLIDDWLADCLAGTIQGIPDSGGWPLLTVLRYVESNPLLAQMVRHAEDWEWSSLNLIKYKRQQFIIVERPGRAA